MVSMVSWFHRFWCGVKVSWCQGSHSFIGFVVSMVSWSYRFCGVNGFMVS